MSLNHYDELLLSKLPHLQIHKNYLPYIGKNFEQSNQRILIVAESHYLPKKYDNKITVEEWYNKPELVYKNIKIEDRGWFSTRDVIKTYQTQKEKKKIEKALTIFSNLENAFHEIEPQQELMTQSAYINYFQRPAEKTGDSINISSLDRIVAIENILVLINVLSLHKIIFVSTKAYNNFHLESKKIENLKLPFIGVVPHPSASSWWNRKSTKYGTKEILTATGREKFIRISKAKNPPQQSLLTSRDI
jgi:hypothetical protein